MQIHFLQNVNVAVHSSIFEHNKVCISSGFGGLEVACWPLVPKFAGSHRAKAVGFFRTKISLARRPLRGSKNRPVPGRRFAVCKRTLRVVLTRYFQAKFTGSPNSSTFRYQGRWESLWRAGHLVVQIASSKIWGCTINLQAGVHLGASAQYQYILYVYCIQLVFTKGHTSPSGQVSTQCSHISRFIHCYRQTHCTLN